MELIGELGAIPLLERSGVALSFCRRPLFSGCGGMDLGFKGGFDFLGKRYAKQPFKLIWANEINEAACKTYQRNLGSHIHQGDIWEMMDSLPKEADVVIGGFSSRWTALTLSTTFLRRLTS